MRLLMLSMMLVLTTSMAYAEGSGGSFVGGGLGVNIPDPFAGLPNGVGAIDGEKVKAFWSCFFNPKCNAFKLDLSKYGKEKETD